MKKVYIIVLILFLSACTPPNYPRKADDNPNYYELFMEENDIIEYEQMTDKLGNESMNIAYKIAGIDETTDSFFLFYYIGVKQNGDIVNILIPDRVGEENLLFIDHLPSFEELEDIVQGYNDSTESTEIDWAGKLVNTSDIELDEAELRTEFVDNLYVSRTYNDISIDVDKESIQDLILDNLSSPIIYRIARYYEPGYNRVKFVYVGKGIEHDLVFILEDSSTAEVEIIYYYDYD